MQIQIEEIRMKLTYRGINYEPENTAIAMSEGEIAGKYRGQPWRYHYPRHIPQLKAKHGLQYRGVHYSNRPGIHQLQPARNLSIPAVTPDGEFPTPNNYISQTKEIAAERVHVETMRRNLERRLSVARENGNEQLVLMLEKEYKDLAIHN